MLAIYGVPAIHVFSYCRAFITERSRVVEDWDRIHHTMLAHFQNKRLQDWLPYRDFLRYIAEALDPAALLGLIPDEVRFKTLLLLLLLLLLLFCSFSCVRRCHPPESRVRSFPADSSVCSKPCAVIRVLRGPLAGGCATVCRLVPWGIVLGVEDCL